MKRKNKQWWATIPAKFQQNEHNSLNKKKYHAKPHDIGRFKSELAVGTKKC